MALIEGVKGVLVLGAGLGLFALAHRDLQSIAEELVRHLHLNPARHLPRIFLHLGANLSDRRLWLLASAAIAVLVSTVCRGVRLMARLEMDEMVCHSQRSNLPPGGTRRAGLPV